MRSIPVTQKKRIATTPIAKDVRTKKVSKSSHVTVHATKISKVPLKVQNKVAKKVTSPYLKRYKRYAKQGIRSVLLSPTFHTSFKIITGLVISTGLLYGSYLYVGKTFANEVVISQSEIVARVAKLTHLPQETPYEIVRVQDKETLRKQNEFYKDVEEGDYILMYKDLAVIYDLRDNRIVATKSVESQ